jgi:hypothetical protein
LRLNKQHFGTHLTSSSHIPKSVKKSTGNEVLLVLDILLTDEAAKAARENRDASSSNTTEFEILHSGCKHLWGQLFWTWDDFDVLVIKTTTAGVACFHHFLFRITFA